MADFISCKDGSFGNMYFYHAPSQMSWSAAAVETFRNHPDEFHGCILVVTFQTIFLVCFFPFVESYNETTFE